MVLVSRIVTLVAAEEAVCPMCTILLKSVFVVAATQLTAIKVYTVHCSCFDNSVPQRATILSVDKPDTVCPLINTPPVALSDAT